MGQQVSAVIPHFSLPFRFAPPAAAVTEQDSLDEIADCVLAILLCPHGLPGRAARVRPARPDVRRRSRSTWTRSRATIETWEPRAGARARRASRPDRRADRAASTVDRPGPERRSEPMALHRRPDRDRAASTSPTTRSPTSKTRCPGWLPSPGNLEAWLIEALAQLAGELRALVALVPGRDLRATSASRSCGLPPYAARAGDRRRRPGRWSTPPATLSTPGRSSRSRRRRDRGAYAFQVVADVHDPGRADDRRGVELRALEAGRDASAGSTGTVQVLDQLDFVELGRRSTRRRRAASTRRRSTPTSTGSPTC